MKKPIIIISIVLAVGIIGTSLYIFRDKIFKRLPTKVSQPAQEVKEEVLVWEDPAGFSFQYPKNVTIDKHDEDEENYAHLELTEASHAGRLIVWAKDATYADVATWVKKDVALKDASLVDTTLGGKPAKKIIIVSPAKKLITGVIDEQILFTVEAEPTEGDAYWQKTYDTIVQSFAFTLLPGQDTSNGSSAVEDTAPVVDEEEVLE